MFILYIIYIYNYILIYIYIYIVIYIIYAYIIYIIYIYIYIYIFIYILITFESKDVICMLLSIYQIQCTERFALMKGGRKVFDFEPS